MADYELVEAQGDADVPAYTVGDHVKLLFIGPRGGESMWVAVTGIDGPTITGSLANNAYGSDLKFGDAITFGPQHVLDVYAGTDSA